VFFLLKISNIFHYLGHYLLNLRFLHCAVSPLLGSERSIKIALFFAKNHHFYPKKIASKLTIAIFWTLDYFFVKKHIDTRILPLPCFA